MRYLNISKVDLGRIKRAHVFTRQHIYGTRNTSIHQMLNEPVICCRGNPTRPPGTQHRLEGSISEINQKRLKASHLEALVAVEVGPLELLDPLLHDLLRQQRHRHLCSSKHQTNMI